ncbi:hypothetical protein SAMN05216553_101463 [Lentzea fradiae]|uniref:Uncharacterized protein n=1 Tax=Lentzea fradiae TaxID=200378 RepID=A0A1G7KTB2_9PSEU|nr:DUF5984 family protein [Lentzea fradiae]SDF40336.1 hypothetical protein SAMN05216553_101463 [Lentzea fradiae]
MTGTSEAAGEIRFHFRLRPLAEVAHWDGRLHWFGLTDGWYRIEVDGHKLFHHGEAHSPVDYYVVRLWEDVQELFPALLEPVPADLADRMTSDQKAWYGRDLEGVDEALDWYSGHLMNTSYLPGVLSVLWWRSVDGDRDTITVDWRHSRAGAWVCAEPGRGRATVSTEAFLRAVEEFDRELIDAMGRRIAEVEAGGVAADVELDLEQLRQEHQLRARSLATAMRRVPATDWTAVREGVARIFGTR